MVCRDGGPWAAGDGMRSMGVSQNVIDKEDATSLTSGTKKMTPMTRTPKKIPQIQKVHLYPKFLRIVSSAIGET